MQRDTEFTKRLGKWLRTREDDRDYAAGCKMFLQLTGRVFMYKNFLAQPDMPGLEAQLQKHYNFRVADLTHEQVAEMSAQVDTIAESHDLAAEPSDTSDEPAPRGKRMDHDTLPPEIQACYVENLSVLRRMREVHMQLRNLSLENSTCPDSDRYPFLKELIDLDKKYRGNWQKYDEYRPE